MADIFISYDRADRPTAIHLADALEANGWSVWLDRRKLRGGQDYEVVIEEEISIAELVIVIWSRNSVKSAWVRAEAAQALLDKKLVPLRIDTASLPLRSNNIFTIDFSSWIGKAEGDIFAELYETITHYLGNSFILRAEDSQPVQLDLDAIKAAYTRGAYKTILRLARPAAENGDHRAQFIVGELFHKGQGIPSNPTEALIWYHKAAIQGNENAQHNLGMLYYQGKGVQVNYSAAASWYKKAAEKNLAGAQYNLGLLYHSGQGLEQDHVKAAEWFHKAAKQGHAGSQYNLGVLYHKGQGVQQNDTLAAERFRKAADQGTAGIQYSFGYLHYKLKD